VPNNFTSVKRGFLGPPISAQHGGTLTYLVGSYIRYVRAMRPRPLYCGNAHNGGFASTTSTDMAPPGEPVIEGPFIHCNTVKEALL